MGVSTQYSFIVPKIEIVNSTKETDTPNNVKRPFTHVLDSELAQIEQINEIIDYESSIGFDQAPKWWKSCKIQGYLLKII